ncbi:MAG: anthranilate phosphoribosyltransferase [Candidatus Eremiobacteraeota bacterium]|nr:anthranilate phosphoribosyltransferase [Candidatus Eremiobacteraeota bacterium]
MAFAIGAIMDAEWTRAQAGAFLAALAVKGETVPEIVGAAEAMRERSLHVEHALPLVVDTCGTGGDGAHTINISTAVGFVVAGAGVPVAKHGNRAASSRCGSADVLEASGVPIGGSPDDARLRLERDGFAFLFAQAYHPAMKEVAPVRRELGVRTVFNLLGPLSNPARATHQVVGVADDRYVAMLGEALALLGGRAGAVVHAASGIDEISGDAPAHVYRFSPSGVVRFDIDPAAFGIAASADAIRGGEPQQNAAALLAILEGERSPRTDVVALNAALALLVADRAESLGEGLALARASLQSGAALAVFEAARRPDRPTEVAHA